MATNLSSLSEPLAPSALKRSIGPLLLTLYGLGTILGAGIYGLIGEVAGAAGPAISGAFLLAGLIAACSALSYAELGGRLPKSAGEAAYVEAAFCRRFPAILAGWAVIATGVVSSATLALPIGPLARVTSIVALAVFLVVNVSLMALKQRVTVAPRFSVPRFIPFAGAVLCAGTLLLQLVALFAWRGG